MSAQGNTGLVRRAVERIWNDGDLALADVLVAPGYVNHGGLIPDLVYGPEAIKIAVALYRTAFPGLHITVEALGADGTIVELQWSARRTPLGAAAGEARGGEEGTLWGTTRCRFDDGQIAESWTSWDRAAALSQLGNLRAEAGP